MRCGLRQRQDMALADERLENARECPVDARVGQALRGIERVGDDAGKRRAQDAADVLVAGDEVDHRHVAGLLCQHMAQAVDRLQPEKPGRLGKRLAREGLKFRPVQRRQADVVPADHLRDVVKIAAVGDALRAGCPAEPGRAAGQQRRPSRPPESPAAAGAAAASSLRSRDRRRTRRPALVPRLLQQRQRLGMRRFQLRRPMALRWLMCTGVRSRRAARSISRRAPPDHIALLAHVHADGNAAALQQGPAPGRPSGV